MTRIARLNLVAAVAAAVALTAGPAPGQVMVTGGAGGGLRPGMWGGPIGPLGVPYGAPNFSYGQRLNVTVGTPFGPSITYRQSYTGAVGWWLSNNNTAAAPRYYMYPARPDFNGGGGSGFLSGQVYGGAGPNPVLAGAQNNLGAAQRQAAGMPATPGGARAAIIEQKGVENGAGPQRPAGPPANLPSDLLDALTVADESRLMNGDYLNRLAAEITALEARGAKGPSAQLGPPLLAQVRFGGTPAGDALNVIRRAGRIDFPAAFDTVDGLKALRPALDQDLVAAAAPLRLGKPADPQKALKLEEDVRKANAALTPAVNSLPFEDATAARRLLNQLDAAARVLRDPKSGGLINPNWDTAGVTAADLVRHMARHKVQFGRAELGDEEVYATVHHALAAYLVALQQNEPKKK